MFAITSEIHASLAKWLSVRLRTKWLWVQIMLLSLKRQTDTAPVPSKEFLHIPATNRV